MQSVCRPTVQTESSVLLHLRWPADQLWVSTCALSKIYTLNSKSFFVKCLLQWHGQQQSAGWECFCFRILNHIRNSRQLFFTTTLFRQIFVRISFTVTTAPTDSFSHNVVYSLFNDAFLWQLNMHVPYGMIITQAACEAGNKTASCHLFP